MATVDVLNLKKEKVGQVDLDDTVFGKEVRKDILHKVVRWQLAKRRQGTHQVKTRSIIAGSSKKPFKQKGTGNARQGNRRSPLMEGGAVVHGPSPRSYEHKLTKKTRQLGLQTALSYLLAEGRLFVVDKIESTDGKTKSLASQLKAFGSDKAVLMTAGADDMVTRAARNLSSYRYYGTEGMNVYDLLKYDSLIMTQDSLEKVYERCGVKK